MSQETFFTNHIDGQFDLYELRLRYDLVEPASNHVITCQVRRARVGRFFSDGSMWCSCIHGTVSTLLPLLLSQVHTPQRHVVHSARSSHSSMMHRPRETGLYELTFQNDMNVDVSVFFEFDTVFYGAWYSQFMFGGILPVCIYRVYAHDLSSWVPSDPRILVMACGVLVVTR
jgi:hypothetical protein